MQFQSKNSVKMYLGAVPVVIWACVVHEIMVVLSGVMYVTTFSQVQISGTCAILYLTAFHKNILFFFNSLAL